MPDDVTLASRTASHGDPALRVKGLDHVVLRVADIDTSIAFYQEVLGLHVERRLAEIGLVQLRAGAAMIDLVPRTEDEDMGRNMDHFAVQIEAMDVPALTAHLKRRGIDPGEVRQLADRIGQAHGRGLRLVDLHHRPRRQHGRAERPARSRIAPQASSRGSGNPGPQVGAVASGPPLSRG